MIKTAAATLYPPTGCDRDLLNQFAAELIRAGVRVGGLVQEINIDADGEESGLNIIEIDTGHRININPLTKESKVAGLCSLNTSALTEASSAIRRAIDQHYDLIIIEKFGEQEQKGQGLASDMLSAISEGIPILISVPQAAEKIWTETTGGLVASLPFELGALREWWEQVK